jgi:hypothetical protein
MLKTITTILALSISIATPAIAQKVNLDPPKEVIDKGFCVGISTAKNTHSKISTDCDRAILANRPDGKKELRFANSKGAGPIFIVEFDNDRYGISTYKVIAYAFFDGKKIIRKQEEELAVTGFCERGGMADFKVVCHVKSESGSLDLRIYQGNPDRSVAVLQVPEKCDELDDCNYECPLVTRKNR